MTSRGLFAAGLLLAILPAPLAASELETTEGRPSVLRFQQVDTGLYRGGQPNAAGFAELARLGIKTVINLRRNSEEQHIVESLGMRYVDLSASLHPFGVGGGLDAAVVERFFQIVGDPASGPVFVHCRRGADRTGTIVAMYRIARQGWNVGDAYREARSLGMRWWHYSVKGFLEEFAATATHTDGLQVAQTPAPP